MKRLFVSVVILCSLSVTAFAGKNSENINFSSTVMIGSAKVDAGEYKVSWTGTDANLQVTVSKSGKTVATAPAKLVQEKSGSVGLSTQFVNGASVVDTLQFRNFKLVLTNLTSTGE